MLKIEVRLQINAPQDEVWKIVSKIGNDPRYWKRIILLRNISRDRNFTTREITLLDGSKCFQKITLFPKEGIHIRSSRGPIVGIKDILLTSIGNTTILEVQMNYKIPGVVRLIPRSMVEELQLEAEQALQLIKQEVEEFLSISQKKMENYKMIV